MNSSLTCATAPAASDDSSSGESDEQLSVTRLGLGLYMLHVWEVKPHAFASVRESALSERASRNAAYLSRALSSEVSFRRKQTHFSDDDESDYSGYSDYNDYSDSEPPATAFKPFANCSSASKAAELRTGVHYFMPSIKNQGKDLRNLLCASLQPICQQYYHHLRQFYEYISKDGNDSSRTDPQVISSWIANDDWRKRLCSALERLGVLFDTTAADEVLDNESLYPLSAARPDAALTSANASSSAPLATDFSTCASKMDAQPRHTVDEPPVSSASETLPSFCTPRYELAPAFAPETRSARTLLHSLSLLLASPST